jgi:hypothetical protein
MRRTAVLFAIATAAVVALLLLFTGRGAWACEHEIRRLFQSVEQAGPYQLMRTNPEGNVFTFEVVPPDRVRLLRTMVGAPMPEAIFIGKDAWSIVNGVPVGNKEPRITPAHLMKTTLWLYSLQISDVDQPSITAQCLGVTNASGRSIRMYAHTCAARSMKSLTLRVMCWSMSTTARCCPRRLR